jgi:predicted RecA/RadA family phage recombinase
MKNQLFTGTPTSARFAACPITVLAGDPVLLGDVPAVALNDYQANTGGATFYTNGTFSLEVIGSSTHSPFTGAAIKPGDKLFASGTLDSLTNVTTDLVITGDSSDPAFGVLDPSYAAGVGSGLTDTAAAVKLGS